jgi:hypothetical protein
MKEVHSGWRSQRVEEVAFIFGRRNKQVLIWEDEREN